MTTTPETEAEADAPTVTEASEDAPVAAPKSKKLMKNVKHIMQVWDFKFPFSNFQGNENALYSRARLFYTLVTHTCVFFFGCNQLLGQGLNTSHAAILISFNNHEACILRVSKRMR